MSLSMTIYSLVLLCSIFTENKIWEAVDDAKMYGDEAVKEMEDVIYFNTPRDVPKPPPTPATAAAGSPPK